MYIEQRRLGWYFTITVPLPLRASLGQPKIVQSLKTRDKVEAQEIAFKLAGDWKARFRELEANDNKPLAPSLNDEARMWQHALKDAEATGDDRSIEVIQGLIYERSEQLHEKRDIEQASGFHGIATGAFVPTDGHLKEWIGELQLAAKTVDMWEREVKRLATKFPTTNLITKASVRVWCMQRTKEGAAVKTVKKTLTACRGYWTYLKTNGVHLADLSPFDDLKLSTRAGEAKRTATASYIPFLPGEVVQLWQAANAKEDFALADLIKVGAYTGTRIEEACAIMRADVAKDWSAFNVADSKSAAGIRQVPVHAELLETLKRLHKASKDDGLIDVGVVKNKYSIRSNAIGKRFGRLKNGLGFTKDRQTFHSIRKTFVTQLEGAGIPENVAAHIVGHELGTMTYGTYSSGVSLAMKAAAVAHVQYDWEGTSL